MLQAIPISPPFILKKWFFHLYYYSNSVPSVLQWLSLCVMCHPWGKVIWHRPFGDFERRRLGCWLVGADDLVGTCCRPHANDVQGRIRTNERLGWLTPAPQWANPQKRDLRKHHLRNQFAHSFAKKHKDSFWLAVKCLKTLDPRVLVPLLMVSMEIVIVSQSFNHCFQFLIIGLWMLSKMFCLIVI